MIPLESIKFTNDTMALHGDIREKMRPTQHF